MFKTFSKSVAIAALVFSVLVLVACGESSQDKATKQVCAAVKEINTQIKKLESLTISSGFPTEAKTSLEAIEKSLKEVKSAEPNLEAARTQEVEAATKSFEAELAAYTKSIASASQSTSLEAALKSAAPQIKASLSKLANEYKKVYDALKCL
jgi:hypothetical protein